MIIRNMYKVILCYIPHRSEEETARKGGYYTSKDWEIEKVAMECFFVTKTKNDEEALAEAVAKVKEYLGENSKIENSWLKSHIKTIVGAYVQKGDYGTYV